MRLGDVPIPHHDGARVYARLRAIMGESAAMYTYCDNSYLMAMPAKMAVVLDHAPSINAKDGLMIGLGPGKTELTVSQGYDKSRFPYPLADPESQPCMWCRTSPHV